MNNIIQLLVAIAIIGLIAYLLTLLPIPAPFVTVIWVVALIGIVLAVVRGLGSGGGPTI